MTYAVPFRSAVVAFAGLLFGVPVVSAQTMRTTTVTRQRHGEKSLNAKIDFGAGMLTLRAGTSPALYRMSLRYDAERFSPVSRFSSADNQLVLGVQNVGTGGLRVSSRRHLEQNATVELSPEVDLSLDVTFGAVEAALDFGGLRITDARIRTTASKSSLHFSRPNRAACSTLELNAGAAEFEALKLGNSGCREITFDGGVGEVTLDMSGAWPSDARLIARVAVGGLTLRLPRNAGVELTVDRFLASFSPAGFTRRGSSYFSDGFEGKTRHLRIGITSKVGDVKVEWVN
ncbi:MAG: hypothetical protein ABI679_11805 [Gemmatimonadota bacterium]